MKIIAKIDEMKKYSAAARAEGKTIALVPTMGYLHEGHMSLIKAARVECDVVAVSVFVNPAQFAPGEDFEKYPRDMEGDTKILGECGVDVMFAPGAKEMYPENFSTYVDVVGRAAAILCGASRPTHFKGVATVVLKLLNIVVPSAAYFGQKDAQQAFIVKSMVRDLDMDVGIRVMPTIREEDGLARSSRNIYLSPRERKDALRLPMSLRRAEDLVRNGVRGSGPIKTEMERVLLAAEGVRIDYIEIVREEDMEPVAAIRGDVLIMAAIFVGKTRLIDNVFIKIGRGGAVRVS